MSQNHEDGVIVGRHSLLRYDVQIPGRAWPWDGVGTLGPQNFEPGETVKIGFLGGNRQLPFIMTQKPWPSYSGRGQQAAIPEPRIWSHYLQGPGRMGSAPWDLVDLRRYTALVPFVYGDMRVTRVANDLIYADIYGGYIAKIDPASGAILGAWAPEIAPTDMIIDGDALYILGTGWTSSVIVKCALETMTTAWTVALGSGPTYNMGTQPYAPTPFSLYAAGGRVGCLCTKQHEKAPFSVMYLCSAPDTGGVPTRVPLFQSEAPPFAGDTVRRQLVSRKQGGIQPWRKICQWPLDFDPEPKYATGSGPTANQTVSPWTYIGDVSETNYSPIVFPESPQEWAPNGQLRWGFNGLIPEEDDNNWQNFTAPRSLERIIQVGKIAVAGTELIIPRARWTPTLAAYTPEGAMAWEVRGWENNGSQPPSQHKLRFFSPLLADRNGRIAVLVRHVTFLDVTLNFGGWESDSGETYDTSVIPPIHLTSWWSQVKTAENPFASRVVLSTEDRLEIYSHGGSRLSSTPLSADKVTSMVHFPTGSAPEGFGYFEVNEPWSPPPDPPRLHTTRSDWYVQPWLSPWLQKGQNPSPVYIEAGEDSFGDGYSGELYIYSDGKARTETARIDDHELYTWDCEEHETSVDAPLLFDKWNPILNSDRSLIIFPQRTWGGGMFDGDGNMRLTNARRTWSASPANQYLENVVLGADYRLGEKRWIYAYDWTGVLRWRHQIPFAAGSTVSFAAPACGGGRLYQIYRVGSTTRIRVIDDKTGVLIEDFVPGNPGQQSGTIGANSHVILCGGVSILVSNDKIVAIRPEG